MTNSSRYSHFYTCQALCSQKEPWIMDAKPVDDWQGIYKKVKGVRLCCCGWGTLCKDIRVTIELFPDGSQYELWKKPYTQILTGNTDKK